MPKPKLYAVARGRTIGLFTAWGGPDGAEVQIKGYPGMRHRAFEGADARARALRWLVDEKAELPYPLAQEARMLIIEPMIEAADGPKPGSGKEERPTYYAIARGRRPGLYSAWYGAGGAKEQVAGLDDAVHRKFLDRSCALVFLHDNGAQVDEALGAEIAAAVAALPPPPSGKDDEARHQVRLSADGCARGNGQGGEVRGGWGALLESGERRKEASGGLLHTTNQRAELYAVLHGIQALRGPSRIWLQSDSMTVINGFRANYHQGSYAGAGNADLWARIAEACADHVIAEATYRSDEHREIRRCHELANAAATGDQLELDVRPEPAAGDDDEPLFPDE